MRQRTKRGAVCTSVLLTATWLAACGTGTTGTREGGTDAPVASDSGGSEVSMPETGAPEASVEDVQSAETAPPTDALEEPSSPPDSGIIDVVAPDAAPDAALGPEAGPDVVAPPVDAPADEEASVGPGDGGGTTEGGGPTDTGPGDAMMNVCGAGEVMCPGGGVTCFNLMENPANCGMCGRACGAGEACVAGACACPAPRATCGGTCIDVVTDNANCGMCGRACPMGQSCNGGMCVCPSGQTSCGTGAAATCSNTQSDPMNCGACGAACGAGQTCVMGACACATGQTRCGTGATSTCVNGQTDNMNCGACGTVCAGGSMCVAGACACPTGEMRCGMGAAAACTNTASDRANCGACGTACTGTQVCNAGVCETSCSAPNTRCGTGAAQVCTNTTMDDQNCGACGTVCGSVPNSFAGLCTSGTCRPVCSANFANCNSMYADGCEVNVTNDLSNCGACGATCPTTATNASGVTCGASRCIPTCQADTATAAFRDCNSSVTDGCETNTLSNAMNCGACGNVCPAGGMCVAGRCASLNCRELHAAAPALPSGIYPIDPDGAGPLAAFNTYCDMTTDGGGWTLVQRTVRDAVMSRNLLTNYATMRSTTLGSPNAGSFFRLAALNWRALEVTGEHMMMHVPARNDNTACNPLFYKASGVLWNFPVAGPATLTGTLVQNVIIFNQQTLSTTDTGPSQNCVNGSIAVPWTYTSCCTTCPTYQAGYWPAGQGRPMASYVAATRDINGRNVTDVCAGNPSPPQLSIGYYGFAEMGYFVR